MEQLGYFSGRVAARPGCRRVVIAVLVIWFALLALQLLLHVLFGYSGRWPS